MIVVHLPFPAPELNPNRCKGKHWASTAALRKSAREAATLLTRQASRGVTFPMGHEVSLKVVFVQPDRRRRDRDNLLAAIKQNLDGVAEALGIDDEQFNPVTVCREYGPKPGSVRIEIGGKPEVQQEEGRS
jgi:Holliday junction resolvase RusA-like endonuclease